MPRHHAEQAVNVADREAGVIQSPGHSLTGQVYGVPTSTDLA
jgi:hypothetical protein